MVKERRIAIARKEILPAVEDYWKTCKDGKLGCKETLKKAVSKFEEVKTSFENKGIPMPTANQLGYGQIRDDINSHAREYGLMQ